MIAQSGKQRAVDVWANYWPEEFFSAYRPLGEIYDKMGMAGQATDIESLIADAAMHGVEKIIISATAVPDTPAGNHAVAKAISGHPDTLIGCASVDPTDEEASGALRQAIEDFGFRALKVLPFLHVQPPNDERYFPLYEICIELAVPLIILTGHQALLVPSEIGRPTHIDDIALRYPDLTIIAGPAGWPWSSELIALAWKHPKLHIHTVIAPSNFRNQYLPPQLIHYANTYGRDKVMWGTGYPFMTYADSMNDVSEIGLEPDAKQAFLWGNAARVWGWD